jgi:hypothetical protein
MDSRDGVSEICDNATLIPHLISIRLNTHWLSSPCVSGAIDLRAEIAVMAEAIPALNAQRPIVIIARVPREDVDVPVFVGLPNVTARVLDVLR